MMETLTELCWLFFFSGFAFVIGAMLAWASLSWLKEVLWKR